MKGTGLCPAKRGHDFLLFIQIKEATQNRRRVDRRNLSSLATNKGWGREVHTQQQPSVSGTNCLEMGKGTFTALEQLAVDNHYLFCSKN